MKPSAVLLIDLENFVLSRFDHFNDESIRSEDRPSFTEDLKNLVRYAQRMAGLPLAVRRAYADFESLRVDPQDLMRQGVEPVQVFRLSGKSANKNAADMKLAMDAVSLLSSGGQFEHFVLVSGDADFIPVILELKRRGHTVSVIAVTGATNELIQRFVDSFELFENLVAAEATKPRVRVGTPDELARVGVAVRRLLGRTRPIRFNVVQPMLSRELGYTFDSAAFGCDSAGEFVRKNCTALGIVVRGTHNEQEIDLPGAPVPSANGSGGSKNVPRQAPRSAPPPVFEPHTPAHYKHLLASGRADANEARVLTIPWASLVWVCDAVVPALTPPDGGPANSVELLGRLHTAARAVGAPELVGHVGLFHPVVRSALTASPDGVYSLPNGADGDELRRRALRYVLFVLNLRLSENKVEGPLRPESVVALFDPGPDIERATAEILAALADASAEPATPPAPVASVKPAPRADDNHVHTTDGYRRLLQKGGPKGSGETEHMRVQPAPWPSVARVCADAFAALSPPGAAPMQRGQFLERLYAAEKEMCVENYRSHVRRAFALLGLSHAILEENDRVTLHPEVAEPGDIRWAVLGIMLKLVAIRLEEKGVAEPVRPDVFVAAIEAGPFTDEMLPEIARAVQGMYQAADEATPEPEQEPVTAELVPHAELQLEVATDYVNEPVPVVDAAHASAAEPTAARGADPSDWDPFAFDGALPVTSPGFLPRVEESSPASGVDVAAITSAAVAAVIEPAVQVLPVAESTAPPGIAPLDLPESELVVFAPALDVPPDRPDDELPLEAPVAEWLTDDDSIFSEPEIGPVRITERLTGSSARLGAPPPLSVQPYADDDALFSDPNDIERITERLTGSSTRLAQRLPSAEKRAALSKMISPPLPPPAVQPPPPPPESA